MTDHLNRMKDEFVSYFLCEFNPTSPKKKLIAIVREVGTRYYSSERTEEFIEKRLDALRTELIDEFNSRREADLPLRFEIADSFGEGHILKGAYKKTVTDKRIKFQDVLHELGPEYFETLAAVVLKRLECDSVFQTPQSHDQGVDAFGYRDISPALSRAVCHKLVWIVQAKHYTKHAVSTNAVRELVGTCELLVNKIFSTVEKRYKELRLAPYTPTGLLLLTTHAIPSTVRRLAERAGVFVFEASDLYELIASDLKRPNVASFERFISDEAKDIPILH